MEKKKKLYKMIGKKGHVIFRTKPDRIKVTKPSANRNTRLGRTMRNKPQLT